MLQDLKLGRPYDGFVFLAEAARNIPWLASHHHIELEVNIVARGRITYVASGRRYTFGELTLVWLFPAQEHRLVHRTPDARYYVAVFKPSLIRSACHGEQARFLLNPRPPERGVLHSSLDWPTFRFLCELMDRAIEGAPDPAILNREAGFGLSPGFRYHHSDPDTLNAGLRHLLVSCWRHQLRAKAGRRRPVELHAGVQKAIERLADGEWPLVPLARACGLAPSHLSRLFARQVGVPISRYRNTVRLDRFWRALRAPSRPTLSEAVFEAGFGSYAQFYRVFREAYGRGPRQCLAQGDSASRPARERYVRSMDINRTSPARLKS